MTGKSMKKSMSMTSLRYFFSVSIVDFEQVSIGWVQLR